MIDIERDVYDLAEGEVLRCYPDAEVSDAYVRAPSKFPHVSIVMQDNPVYDRTQTSSSSENHVQPLFEVMVYSNKRVGRKSECKAIMTVIDGVMSGIGFTRIMLEPIPNINDATVYRMAARYRAVVSQNKTIYRR